MVEDRRLLLTWSEIFSEVSSVFDTESLKSSIMDNLFHDYEDYEDQQAEWDRWIYFDWARVEEQLIERSNRKLPVGLELTSDGLVGPPDITREEAEHALGMAADSIDEYELVREIFDAADSSDS